MFLFNDHFSSQDTFSQCASFSFSKLRQFLRLSCTCDDLDSFENNGLILPSPSFWLYLFFFFLITLYFRSVQSLSHVCLFVTPWNTACQACLFIPKSWGLLKLMSIESVMSFNHQLCCYFIHLFLIFEKQHEVNYHYCIMSRVYIINMNSVF